MNFGDILKQWEQEVPYKENQLNTKAKKSPEWYDQYIPGEEDTIQKEKSVISRGIPRRRLEKMEPQDEIDLHGHLKDEILPLLESFICRCRKRKVQKILIIHGKGLHSPEGAILRPVIHKYLKESKDIVDWGRPPARLGGSGATWAIIRR